jgi:hypothetical protein
MAARPLLIPLVLSAQLSAQALGSLAGTVATPDGNPLALALVSVAGTKATALTGADGGFHLALAPGAFLVHVRMTGYGSVLLPVEVRRGETTEVRVTLVIAPVPLAPVEVEAARVPLPAMRGFEERRAHGNGHFFNRREIDRIQPRVFTDVLRRVPGIQVQPMTGPSGAGEVVRMSRTIGVTGTRACPVLYYVNGTPFPVTGDVPINHYIAPEDIEAIEVYSGMSQIPPAFNSSLHNARCGVILIWTLSGEDTTTSP